MVLFSIYLCMNCPTWQKCNIKSCIEQEKCNFKDAPIFWKEMTHKQKRLAKNINNLFAFQNQYPSLECGYRCDKKEACTVLNQCVMTLSAVTGNKALFAAIRSPMSLKKIIQLLEIHNPKPMRSYYLPKQKKKRKKK